MIPPPIAANMPSLRPVRAMTGVPKQVATNRAPAIGTWLPPFARAGPFPPFGRDTLADGERGAVCSGVLTGRR